MKDNQVFFKNAEIKRLNTQKRLFSEYECSLYQKVLNRDELVVLDIGCNNGDKTKEKFDVPQVGRVIGLEYHKVLTDHAQKKYGSDKFSFYQCNVEDEGFAAFLSEIMQKHGIGGFDIIHLSLVLSHLTDSCKLLGALRPFLSPGGRLLILESDDSAVEVVPDTFHVLPGFMSCLAMDAYAGDRSVATRLPSLLRETGYRDVEILEVNISASGDNVQKKCDIYDVFFSYLLPDMRSLLKEDPENEEYKRCESWLRKNSAHIKDTICKYSERIVIGIKLFVACGGNEN